MRLGTAGLAATGTSVALTFSVAALGPSIMTPALAGPPGQPPWAVTARPSPYLAVALAAAAILTGATGLTLCVNAMRRGWRAPPGLILAAGISCAVALAFVPPFGSSDHLSYAAYGRMASTGHDPYTTTPAELARLGDPVARAVADWKASPSVYGPLAVAAQALAAWIGAGSVRLTVFVLSLLDVIAFTATGLLLHRLGRGDAGRQLRTALLWTANPLLLMVLVAGAHVDSQAIVFGVAAVAVAVAGQGVSHGDARLGRQALTAAGAGVMVGLGFAIKVTTALVGVGLAIGLTLPRRRPGRQPGGDQRAAGPAGSPAWRRQAAAGWLAASWLAAGFLLTAAAALLPWGTAMFGPALHAGSYTSIGSPWRPVRSGLELLISDHVAQRMVEAGALVLAAWLVVALLRHARDAAADRWPVACAFAVVVAWLLTWPYVLPWYDGLGWALLALLPASRLDWLLLARTTALAIGYLPARGIRLPPGLGWLEMVARTALTPAVLLAVLVLALAASRAEA